MIPLALALLADDAVPPGTVLDLGCGEGQVMRSVAGRFGGDRGRRVVVGTDLAGPLLAQARSAGPVCRARLPSLAWIRAGALAGAYAVLVVEHLADLEAFFVETARVVAPAGCLVVVMNHPAFTAPGAGPIVDPTDGEVFWRWGPYLSTTRSEEPAGDDAVTFHHRPAGAVLTAAAAAGWCVERVVERGVGEEAAARDPLLAAQRHMPRLLGLRWRRHR